MLISELLNSTQVEYFVPKDRTPSKPLDPTKTSSQYCAFAEKVSI